MKTIVHGYDDAGREVSVSDGVTAYQYQYDLADRMTQVDNAGSVLPQVTLNNYYDFEGNRVGLSDSQGGRVEYAWFDQRLQSMVMTTADFKSARVNFGYDQVGRLDSIFRMVNGDPSTTIDTTYTLDLLDRVTSITHDKISGAGAVTLSQFSYTYDANGRVIGSTGPEGSLSFALDANGQLLSVTGSRSEAYAFDTNGNRSTNTTGTGNLLLSDGQFSYTYDFEGNRKTRTRLSDGQVTEYYWDHRNQLTKALIKSANGVILKELRFTYDVEGRRVGEWVDADGAGPGNPDQVWTVFDGVNPCMDLDVEGNIKNRYLHGPGIDELFARIGAGEDPEWYLPDRLGSTRQIVDAEGSILDAIVYDNFGNILSETNPSQGDRFKFTGREYCPELGIYYYRARWYDPATGRFISPDPIGFRAGDPNLYRYVGNAPGDGTDPEGLTGPGYHHPYLLYLGGGLNQPVFYLSQEGHLKVHQFFQDKGYGYEMSKKPNGQPFRNYDYGRGNWVLLDKGQQAKLIKESLELVGINKKIIKEQIEHIMAGATPGENNSSLRNKCKPKAIFGSPPNMGGTKNTKIATSLGAFLVVNNVTYGYDLYLEKGGAAVLDKAIKASLMRELRIDSQLIDLPDHFYLRYYHQDYYITTQYDLHGKWRVVFKTKLNSSNQMEYMEPFINLGDLPWR